MSDPNPLRVFRLGAAIGGAITGAEEALQLLDPEKGGFLATDYAAEARCRDELRTALEHLKRAAELGRKAIRNG